MPRRFAQSLRCGVYLQVLREGQLAAGDPVRLGERGPRRLTIRSLFAAYLKPTDPAARRLLAEALEMPALSPQWREQIGQRLQRAGHAKR